MKNNHVKNDAGLYEARIDGALYEFGKWPAEDALEVLVDLMGVMGPGVAPALTSGYFDGGETADLRRITLDKTLQQLATQLTTHRSTVLRLLKRLGTHQVTCDGRRIEFQSHYQERLMHLFKVVRAALEVQFADFLAALSGLAPARPKQSAATNTSTGNSGGP